MILDDYFHTTMRDDATMRSLTGKSAPTYGIFMVYPPKKLSPPYIVHRDVGHTEDNDKVKATKLYAVTCFGNNYQSLKSRVIALFDETSNTSFSDYYLLQVLLVFQDPVQYDPQLEVFWQTVTFQCKIVRK